MHRVFQLSLKPLVGLLLFGVSALWADSLPLRVLTANLTTGNKSRYEAPGLRIISGLKPDVVAIQEFRYEGKMGTDTPAARREMVDKALGTQFEFYCEPYVSAADIPNGIISRWPIRKSGSWPDPGLNNRGFAWAQIDLPGVEQDLYVVSVHLHSGGGKDRRAEQVAIIQKHIQAEFPPKCLLIVAGDLNVKNRQEPAVQQLLSFMIDDPPPTDAEQDGNPNTNNPYERIDAQHTRPLERNRPYDCIFISPKLAYLQVPVMLGGRRFPAGLVFDSRMFTPLRAVSPIRKADSGADHMQHMAVIKDFAIPRVHSER